MKKEEELQQLAEEFIKKKDYVNLNETVEELVKYFPKQCSGYFYRGIYKYLKSDYDGAIKDYTTAIKIDPFYENAYYYRAKAYTRIKKIDNAYEDYGKIIQLSPQKSRGYSSRAWLLWQHRLGDGEYRPKDWYGIIENFENAIKVANKDSNNFIAQCYYMIGVSYGNLRENEEALSSFRKAITYYEKELQITNDISKISDDYGESFRWIAEIKEECEDYEGALNALNKAIELGVTGREYLRERYEKHIEKFEIISNTKKLKISELPKNELDKILSETQHSNQRRELLFLEKNIIESRNNIIYNQCYRRTDDEEDSSRYGRFASPTSNIIRHSATLTYYFLFDCECKLDIDTIKNQLEDRIKNDNFFWKEGLLVEFQPRQKTEYLLTVSKYFESNERFLGMEAYADYRKTIGRFLQDTIDNKSIHKGLEQNANDFFQFEENDDG